MMFFSFGLFIDVLIFCLGCYWQVHLIDDLPKHIREVKGTNPKIERWPAAVVLGLSALLLLWMLGFLLSYLVFPVLRGLF